MKLSIECTCQRVGTWRRPRAYRITNPECDAHGHDAVRIRAEVEANLDALGRCLYEIGDVRCNPWESLAQVDRDAWIMRACAELRKGAVTLSACGDIDAGAAVVTCECGKVRQLDRPHGYDSRPDPIERER